MTDLLAEAQELFEYTQFMRRDFHRHPELGFQEVRTAGVVARELNSLGLEVTPGIAETGVVGLLEGARPGPVLMLRFDMDALPILEDSQAPYVSENTGVMHACGHDGHTAVGLTVARLLQNHRQEIAGSVKMVFQPAEEGLGGAARMISEGVLQDPRPDFCLAMHVWNDRPVGWVGASPGPIMAAGEIFSVHLTGKGGHGAAPMLAIDPVVAAAQIINALQSIVSRNVSPLQAAVVTVAALSAGEAFNVIPQYADLKGTMRSFDPQVRATMLERFRDIVAGVAGAMGCTADIDIQSITPAVSNDPAITERMQAIIKSVLPDADLATAYATMGSEDMAFFMREIPGSFIFVGSANPEQGLNAPHHHPKFDIDERALPMGAAILASAALDFLK